MSIIKAIQKLRPNAEVTIINNDYATAIWHKIEGNPPTEAEVHSAMQQIEIEETQIKAEAAVAKAALLNKLGITEEEAKLLLGGN
jgi:hypothetical protein